MLGIHRHLFTPIFAVSRIVGYTAHILEQYDDNKIIRPKCNYVGDMNRKFVPIDKRWARLPILKERVDGQTRSGGY